MRACRGWIRESVGFLVSERQWHERCSPAFLSNTCNKQVYFLSQPANVHKVNQSRMQGWKNKKQECAEKTRQKGQKTKQIPESHRLACLYLFFMCASNELALAAHIESSRHVIHHTKKHPPKNRWLGFGLGLGSGCLGFQLFEKTVGWWGITIVCRCVVILHCSRYKSTFSCRLSFFLPFLLFFSFWCATSPAVCMLLP